MQLNHFSNAAWAPRLLSLMRAITGFLFIQHGTDKLAKVHAGAVQLGSLIGAAGLLELVGGALILVGLFTRPTAFILSGMMAVAYFMAHAPKNFLPIQNGGELAVLFCFVFLYLAAAGGGNFSLDTLRSKKK
jgi:putative oxidoreductase